MNSFFKMFFASLLAMVIFMVIGFFLFFAVIAGLASREKPKIDNHSVLVLDLSQGFSEKEQSSVPFVSDNKPGLSDAVRLIEKAKTDKDIEGIYIEANGNANGFASSHALRDAIEDFRKSKKFVIAYGDMMSQGAYYVASAADRVYVNPAGQFEWKGFAVSMAFLKGMLDKLEIEPQIFYAGKFKSATEPLRATEMTPENKLQTTVWLNELYNQFLQGAAKKSGLDTTQLRVLADSSAIRTPQDAASRKLIDAVKYDDEVKAELKQKLSLDKDDELSLVSLNTYNESVSLDKSGKDRIAVIYAEGTIVDGDGASDNIGGERFRKMIRKARMDESVRAIVLRVNSGGGSALASEVIWRELKMAKADGKPVVVSFGDVAASGGYYIASGADSIFTYPNTITGSIGVFSVVPNMGSFFKSKLGITFDGVKTGRYADAPTVSRPLTEGEKKMMQDGVERTYALFKQRVSEGRKLSASVVDSIAQGRVWSGAHAVEIGLADRIGGLPEAIRSAAKLAKLGDDYGMKEFPEKGNWLNELFEKKKTEPEVAIRQQIGEDNYKIYREMQRVREITGSVQARLPFEFFIH